MTMTVNRRLSPGKPANTPPLSCVPMLSSALLRAATLAGPHARD